MTLMN